MMQEITGEAPVMWGTSIIGFGTCPLTYANGKLFIADTNNHSIRVIALK